jgi:hypothetical protein
MDESTRLRMRRAHANHGYRCECGRMVYGNGHKSHLRTCAAHLDKVGWPLDEGMAQAIRDVYRNPLGVVMGVQQRLGQFYLARRKGGDLTPLPWPEFRDLVWRYAAEAANELTP